MRFKPLHLFCLLTLLFIPNVKADSAFVYEEGVSNQKETAKEEDYNSKIEKGGSIQDKGTTVSPKVEKRIPSISTEVELPKNKPLSFYQKFIHNTKKGAVIALAITMLFFIIALGTGQKRVFIGAPLAGFPIIWLIVTFVCVFVTSC